MNRSQTPTAGKSHVRNESATIATRPRSSTKGPLDIDDSPSDTLRAQTTTSTATSSRPSPRSSSPKSTSVHGPTSLRHMSSRQDSPGPRTASPMRKAASSARQASMPPHPATRTKDFSYLLRPEIYHTLPATAAAATNVPPPFQDASSRQPDPDATVGIADDVSGTLLADLLAAGHFRAAAIVAARQLVATPDPTDHARIFSLLYTRLVCLLLLDATSLATQEAKALEDLNNPFYRGDPVSGADDHQLPPHLVPWELRVLHVRLQALGFGDPRRAVMSYYELAREARIRIADALAAQDDAARESWQLRLAELGIQVAGALIEMDDLAGAAAHLRNLNGQSSHTDTSANTTRSSRRIAMARALLWLQLGDVDEARAAMGEREEPDLGDSLLPRGTHGSVDHDLGQLTAARVVAALCDMADGEYKTALASWRRLREDAPDDEMIGVNLAVCMLYVGQMQEGRTILEQLVDAGASSHTLLFNLSTMYELCTDRAKTFKLGLAQRVADQTPVAGQSWEKTNADFKL